MLTRILTAVLVLMLAAGPHTVLAIDFVPDDQIVSDPSISLIDPEFDQGGNRMAWQDLIGNLWVADIDPANGDIIPASGRGTLIDTGTALVQDTLNGPEWSYGSNGTFITYTDKTAGYDQLAYAKDDGIGGWILGLPRRGFNRSRTFGTPPSNNTQARVAYFHESSTGTVSIAWRDVQNWLSEKMVEAPTSLGGRWVERFDVFITTIIIDGVRQVVTINTNTGDVTQLTFDPEPKFLPFMWYAPELGQLAFMAMINKTDLGIFRNIGDDWVNVYRFQVPSSKPFLHSPEPFTYNGRSYIVTVTADALGSPDGNWPAQPQGPTEIWITGIDEADPFFRRVDDPSEEHNRLDPETYVTENGPVVYYTEKNLDLNSFLLRRAATGL